jgi:hypothetical protein
VAIALSQTIQDDALACELLCPMHMANIEVLKTDQLTNVTGGAYGNLTDYIGWGSSITMESLLKFMKFGPRAGLGNYWGGRRL